MLHCIDKLTDGNEYVVATIETNAFDRLTDKLQISHNLKTGLSMKNHHRITQLVQE